LTADDAPSFVLLPTGDAKCLFLLSTGDALFFHCNTIHHSSANKSDLRRWAFIMTYNRASNNPTMVHHHPQYTPLEKVCIISI
jgi:hypothetical protein